MTDPSQSTVNGLLAQARSGDGSALQRLFPLVYDQLLEIARKQRRRRAGHETLNTTALVHEAYLKLVGQERLDFNDRAHFMAVAATAMRQILIDYARRRSASKRGGGLPPVSFAAVEASFEAGPAFSDLGAEALIALDAALQRLRQVSERQSRIIECRFFGGMTIEETAAALDVSPATVKRGSTTAQAWLYREIGQLLA